MEPNECTWQPPKGIKKGLEHSDDLKAILSALSKIVEGKELDEVQEMIREAESLTGEIAEHKAQLLEVLSSTFIPQRVEDETAGMHQEQLDWNAKNMGLRMEIDRIKAEIERTDSGKVWFDFIHAKLQV